MPQNLRSVPPDFYPRSPCGERRPSLSGTARHTYFYPRSPCGERHTSKDVIKTARNFYPRSPCGERQESQQLYARPTTDFYPRSPCGERQTFDKSKKSKMEFLSTLSLRRATAMAATITPTYENISIHALLAESDGCDIISIERCSLFLSTLSLRRATR